MYSQKLQRTVYTEVRRSRSTLHRDIRLVKFLIDFIAFFFFYCASSFYIPLCSNVTRVKTMGKGYQSIRP